ncbi:MAG: Phosphate-binding protein PstS precursor [Planctomycetes bacterium ADurb.Bin126]|nr:MAG: Phosphate-binding protein PstS precursor [Planctomycetes bacterium ADurb.Bin126]
MNKIEVLATGQVREPFGPRARSWKAFSGVDAEIRRYCPISTDPATKLFHEKVLPLSQCGPMVRKKTSAEVIAAVSMDPQGIGFVDYTAIRKDNKRFGPERLTAEGSIKVLGIVTDKGIVRPEPKTILDGTWPISQQYYLYVNPKASETAKDFAKFIVSGACADVFRKHGMVPAPPQKLEFPTTQPEPGE